jgi:hypothetical protein
MKSDDLSSPSVDETAPSSVGRRAFLGRASLFGAVAAFTPAALLLGTRDAEAESSTALSTDLAVLNFALNLEYLEAEYYLHGVYGSGLSGGETTGSGARGEVVVESGAVNFETKAIQQYATEIAEDEHDHVRVLRHAIKHAGGTPAARPKIDLLNSFVGLGNLIGVPNFDPFANEVNFLLGAFIFEDVGVTAYNGAAPLISRKSILGYAASILAVEAYHAGSVRTQLYALGNETQTLAGRISQVRSSLGGGRDQGISLNGTANIVPTNSQGLAFTRTTRQVLNIVYGKVGASRGLFFPNGLNGAITK